MVFLETITAMGESMLVPISSIQFILIRHREDGWAIKIQGEYFECMEYFGDDEERLDKRYQMIKKLLGVPEDSK